MTKQKKKNNNNNKGQQKPKKPARQKPKPGGSLSLAMAACSLTNPFCVEAIGARWPDNSYTKSVGWSVTNLPITISTNATGKAATLWTCRPTFNYAGSTVVDDVITYSATLSSHFTGPSNFARWRVTSWGFKINCIAAPMTLTGVLRVRLFSPMNLGSVVTSSLTTSMADAVMDIPLHRLLDRDLFVIPMPLGTNARLFNDTSALNNTTSSAQTFGWQTVQIGIDGAPFSSPVIQISMYYNFEFVFEEGSASNAFAQPPPTDHPLVRSISAPILSRLSNFVSGTADKVESMAITAATSMLGRMAGAYVGGPAGAAIGMGASMMIRDVD